MSTLEDAFPKTPDVVREEKMIALLEQLNENLAIMGQAMLKLADAMMEPEPIAVTKSAKVYTDKSPKKDKKNVKNS